MRASACTMCVYASVFASVGLEQEAAVYIKTLTVLLAHLLAPASRLCAQQQVLIATFSIQPSALLPPMRLKRPPARDVRDTFVTHPLPS